jgi:enoyl-CoA hydratase
MAEIGQPMIQSSDSRRVPVSTGEIQPSSGQPSIQRRLSFANDKILQDTCDGVGTITFNNPAKHNAMSLDMWVGLGDAIGASVENPDVRVIVFVGAGGKAFVSGADISQFEELRHNAEATEQYALRSGAARKALDDCPKPTIACIDGFCIGGGLLVAMLADIRVAAEGSQFGIPAAKLGVAYGYQGLERLVSLVGPSRARLLMYTGMRIDAAEALKIGLVDRVVDPVDLWADTTSLARTIAENAPLAVAAARITIAQILKDTGRRDMATVKQVETQCSDSEDFCEGRRAFMEKRRPMFRGR